MYGNFRHKKEFTGQKIFLLYTNYSTILILDDYIIIWLTSVLFKDLKKQTHETRPNYQLE